MPDSSAVRPGHRGPAWLRSLAWSGRLLPRSLPGAAEGSAGHQRRGLVYLWGEGLLTAASDAFIGPYLALYLLALGANAQQIGLLSGVSALASAATYLPGALLTRRFPSYRTVVVAILIPTHTMLLLLVILPWVASGQAAIAAAIVLTGLRSGIGQIGNPAWIALLAILVPPGLRGRFFAARTLVSNLAAILVLPLAGYLISRLGMPDGYQLSFGLSLAAAVLATVIVARLPLPPGERSGHARGPGLGQALRGLGQHRTFVHFVLISMLLNLGIQFVAPFFNVYLVRQLGADAAFIGLQNTAAALATMAAMPLFGPLVDRRGLRWTMLWCGPFVAVMPLCWLFVRHPWQTLPLWALVHFAWGGFNLATFNLLLAATPEEGRPLYSALHNTASAASGMVGPLLGGFVFDHWGFAPCAIGATLGRGGAIVLIYFLLRGPSWLGPMRAGHEQPDPMERQQPAGPHPPPGMEE